MDPDDQTQQGIPDEDVGLGPAPAPMQQAIPDDDSDQSQPQQQPFNIIGTIGSGVKAIGRGVANAGQTVADVNAAQPEPTGSYEPQKQQMIASLLMGKGATPPAEAQAMADEFKKKGANDDQANLLAVITAGQKGGQAAEWGMVQYNRTAFNAKQSFALAALNGVDGKASDLNAATTAATQASSHILDGSTAVFHASGVGGRPDASVGVIITNPDGSKDHWDMSRNQFAQYLDLSKTSQFDRLMQTGGIAGAMHQIGAIQQNGTSDGKGDPNFAGTTKVEQGVQQGGGDTPSQGGDKDQDRFQTGGEGAKGNTPEGNKSMLADRAKADQQKSDDDEYARSEDRLLEEGNKRFPWASQSAQRNAWMAQERARRESNESQVEVAQEKGKLANQRAAITGGFRVGAAQATAGGRVGAATVRAGTEAEANHIKRDRLQMDQASRNNNEQGRMLRGMMAANPSLTLEDANAQLAKENLPKIATTPQVIQGVRGNSAQSDQPTDGQGSSVPPAASRIAGQIYTTPKGQFRWTGNGWQATQ